MVHLYRMLAVQSGDNPRLPHVDKDAAPATVADLGKMGVRYLDIPVSNHRALIDELKAKEGFTYEDEITIDREKLPDYDKKIASFFEEHLHTDDEVRYFLEGSGYFDVRDGKDKWIRIAAVAGDLLILPAGIYHRFTADEKDYAKVIRLFAGDPKWTPYNRPSDDMKERSAYLKKYGL